MILIYKVLSLLLDYPTKMIQDTLPRIVERVREEGYLDQTNISRLEEFIAYASSMSLTQWQERYVTLFDHSLNTNLYLFDHVYGSSRERGQAMVDLKEMYMENGFIPCGDELPDYLPLFLEFVSIQSSHEKAEKLLVETAHVLNNMHRQIEKQQTPYAALINILCQLAKRAETLAEVALK